MNTKLYLTSLDRKVVDEFAFDNTEIETVREYVSSVLNGDTTYMWIIENNVTSYLTKSLLENSLIQIIGFDDE